MRSKSREERGAGQGSAERAQRSGSPARRAADSEQIGIGTMSEEFALNLRSCWMRVDCAEPIVERLALAAPWPEEPAENSAGLLTAAQCSLLPRCSEEQWAEQPPARTGRQCAR